MNKDLQRAEKVMNRINRLASVSEEPGVITRTFGTKAFLEGRALVKTWMNEAGLETNVDQIGNVRGKLRSDNPEARTFVIASHIDTVVNAGKFDGPLGVLMGLDLLEQLILHKVQLPFHIELIAFSDEEGVRFHTTFLGSKAVTGAFDYLLLEKKDEKGIALKEVIYEMGGDAGKIAEDMIPVENWLGYFEMHIEQGPVLYERNIPAAIVTGIAGQKRIELGFTGFAGHAGTVPMNMRKDALCNAAEVVLAIEKYALENGAEIVATVGKLQVVNAASNVIPGEVICSLDLRSADNEKLEQAYDELKSICETISAKRKIAMSWQLIQETAPVICDTGMNELLESAIRDAGYEVIKLVSGAGHDAVPVSLVAPVTMLFIRCFQGISHNPLENVAMEDLASAIEISDRFIKSLLNQHP
ncbi:allantoate deiminase [Pseudarcicella hirudinis]|uniref:Allantoate deiminase n=1 Tax=Pseudarcicella hirudinis TaxID=1079859 RepID=A0A1I5S2J2_9BACT|nr:allantoate amidohydrolase [Pseudarcicella hirudinis]SFP64992.1 allantoate deiminase [Pseudarcicella hirudinis]